MQTNTLRFFGVTLVFHITYDLYWLHKHRVQWPTAWISSLVSIPAVAYFLDVGWWESHAAWMTIVLQCLFYVNQAIFMFHLSLPLAFLNQRRCFWLWALVMIGEIVTSFFQPETYRVVIWCVKNFVLITALLMFLPCMRCASHRIQIVASIIMALSAWMLNTITFGNLIPLINAIAQNLMQTANTLILYQLPPYNREVDRSPDPTAQQLMRHHYERIHHVCDDVAKISLREGLSVRIQPPPDLSIHERLNFTPDKWGLVSTPTTLLELYLFLRSRPQPCEPHWRQVCDFVEQTLNSETPSDWTPITHIVASVAREEWLVTQALAFDACLKTYKGIGPKHLDSDLDLGLVLQYIRIQLWLFHQFRDCSESDSRFKSAEMSSLANQLSRALFEMRWDVKATKQEWSKAEKRTGRPGAGYMRLPVEEREEEEKRGAGVGVGEGEGVGVGEGEGVGVGEGIGVDGEESVNSSHESHPHFAFIHESANSRWLRQLQSEAVLCKPQAPGGSGRPTFTALSLCSQIRSSRNTDEVRQAVRMFLDKTQGDAKDISGLEEIHDAMTGDFLPIWHNVVVSTSFAFTIRPLYPIIHWMVCSKRIPSTLCDRPSRSKELQRYAEALRSEAHTIEVSRDDNKSWHTTIWPPFCTPKWSFLVCVDTSLSGEEYKAFREKYHRTCSLLVWRVTELAALLYWFSLKTSLSSIHSINALMVMYTRADPELLRSIRVIMKLYDEIHPSSVTVFELITTPLFGNVAEEQEVVTRVLGGERLARLAMEDSIVRVVAQLAASSGKDAFQLLCHVCARTSVLLECLLGKYPLSRALRGVEKASSGGQRGFTIQDLCQDIRRDCKQHKGKIDTDRVARWLSVLLVLIQAMTDEWHGVRKIRASLEDYLTSQQAHFLSQCVSRSDGGGDREHHDPLWIDNPWVCNTSKGE